MFSHPPPQIIFGQSLFKFYYVLNAFPRQHITQS